MASHRLAAEGLASHVRNLISDGKKTRLRRKSTDGDGGELELALSRVRLFPKEEAGLLAVVRAGVVSIWSVSPDNGLVPRLSEEEDLGFVATLSAHSSRYVSAAWDPRRNAKERIACCTIRNLDVYECHLGEWKRTLRACFQTLAAHSTPEVIYLPSGRSGLSCQIDSKSPNFRVLDITTACVGPGETRVAVCIRGEKEVRVFEWLSPDLQQPTLEKSRSSPFLKGEFNSRGLRHGLSPVSPPRKASVAGGGWFLKPVARICTRGADTVSALSVSMTCTGGLSLLLSLTDGRVICYSCKPPTSLEALSAPSFEWQRVAHASSITRIHHLGNLYMATQTDTEVALWCLGASSYGSPPPLLDRHEAIAPHPDGRDDNQIPAETALFHLSDARPIIAVTLAPLGHLRYFSSSSNSWEAMPLKREVWDARSICVFAGGLVVATRSSQRLISLSKPLESLPRPHPLSPHVLAIDLVCGRLPRVQRSLRALKKALETAEKYKKNSKRNQNNTLAVMAGLAAPEVLFPSPEDVRPLDQKSNTQTPSRGSAGGNESSGGGIFARFRRRPVMPAPAISATSSGTISGGLGGGFGFAARMAKMRAKQAELAAASGTQSGGIQSRVLRPGAAPKVKCKVNESLCTAKEAKSLATLLGKLEKLAENERNVISVISKADFKSLRILAEAVSSAVSANGAVDHFGLRFKTSLKILTDTYGGSEMVMKTIAAEKKKSAISREEETRNLGLPTLKGRDFVLALHSEEQKAFVREIASVKGYTWDWLHVTGIVFWIRSDLRLRELVETAGKNAFANGGRDPNKAMLWHLIAGKLSVLRLLFETDNRAKSQRLLQLLKKDFSDPKGPANKVARTLAVKFMALHRFHHSVAFFCLAKDFDSAAQVASRHLEDPALLLLIARLTMDSERKKKTINELVLPLVKDNPFLTHAAHWQAGNPAESLSGFERVPDGLEPGTGAILGSFLRLINSSTITYGEENHRLMVSDKVLALNASAAAASQLILGAGSSAIAEAVVADEDSKKCGIFRIKKSIILSGLVQTVGFALELTSPKVGENKGFAAGRIPSTLAATMRSRFGTSSSQVVMGIAHASRLREDENAAISAARLTHTSPSQGIVAAASKALTGFCHILETKPLDNLSPIAASRLTRVALAAVTAGIGIGTGGNQTGGSEAAAVCRCGGLVGLLASSIVLGENGLERLGKVLRLSNLCYQADGKLDLLKMDRELYKIAVEAAKDPSNERDEKEVCDLKKEEGGDEKVEGNQHGDYSDAISKMDLMLAKLKDLTEETEKGGSEQTMRDLSTGSRTVSKGILLVLALDKLRSLLKDCAPRSKLSQNPPSKDRKTPSILLQAPPPPGPPPFIGEALRALTVARARTAFEVGLALEKVMRLAVALRADIMRDRRLLKEARRPRRRRRRAGEEKKEEKKPTVWDAVEEDDTEDNIEVKGALELKGLREWSFKTGEELWKEMGGRRIGVTLAEEISGYIRHKNYGWTTLYRAAEVYKDEKGLAVMGVMVNTMAIDTLAVSTSHGIREISAFGAMNFRMRSADSRRLKDPEKPSWEGCLHRYDGNFLALQDLTTRLQIKHPNPSPTRRLASIITPPKSFALVSPRHISPTPLYSKVLRNFEKKSKKSVSGTGMGGGFGSRDAPAVAVATHPSLPLYATATVDGRITLWHFARVSPVWDYVTGGRSNVNGKVVALRFNQQGNKLGCACLHGKLHLFHLGTPRGPRPSLPFSVLDVSQQIKPLYDFVFIKCSGSLVAVAGGNSRSDLCVCIFDSLLVEATGFRHSFKCHMDAAASCLVYISRTDVLISGGTKGKLFSYDLKMMKDGGFVSHSQNPNHRVDTLAYDEHAHIIASAGLDGDVRLWTADLPLHPLQKLPGICGAKSVSRHPANPGIFSSFAVTAIAFRGGNLYVCTADGSVVVFSRRDALEAFDPVERQDLEGS